MTPCINIKAKVWVTVRAEVSGKISVNVRVKVSVKVSVNVSVKIRAGHTSCVDVQNRVQLKDA